MIDSLHIKNFRGFRDLSLSGLRSINIVVGKNASGKTALLEAIRVGLSGTPQALWQVNQSRMAGFPIPMGPSRESFENIWSSDFFTSTPRRPSRLNSTTVLSTRLSLQFFMTLRRLSPQFQNSPQRRRPIFALGI
jgi:AAA15 family ATPase/GTPase